MQSLDRYLECVQNLGAPVARLLAPGEEAEQIDHSEQRLGIKFPFQLREYWAKIGGLKSIRDWDIAILIPLGAGHRPLSLQDAQDSHDLFEEMREENPTGDQEFADVFWPEGFAKFVGDDVGGLWVNCRVGSPTYGYVYARLINSDFMMQLSADLEALFSLFCAAYDEGAITLAKNDNPYFEAGTLVADEAVLFRLAGDMNSSCQINLPDNQVGREGGVVAEWV